MSADPRTARRTIVAFVPFVAGALIVAALVLVVTARALPGSRQGGPGSVLSAEGDGLRGLFLLARRLGWDARAWEGAPADLPLGATLVLGTAPEPPPGYEWRPEQAAEQERAGERVRTARRTRDPRHYRHFLERGGLLLAAATPEVLAFLDQALEIAPVGSLQIVGDPGPERTRVVFDTGERLRLSSVGGERFAALLPGGPFTVLATDGDGLPRVLVLPVGRGRLCLFSSPVVLENQHLRRRDNALFFVRLLERLEAPAPLWFDEYALGGWTPDTPLELAFGPAGRVLSIQLLLALVLWAWGLVWVGPFARDRSRSAAVAPGERARALGRLLERAQRWSLLGRLLRRGVVRRLVPGARGAWAHDAREASFVPSDEDDLERLLRPLVIARAGEDGWGEAREVFSRNVVDREGLERLERELSAWEQRLAPRSGTANTAKG